MYKDEMTEGKKAMWHRQLKGVWTAIARKLCISLIDVVVGTVDEEMETKLSTEDRSRQTARGGDTARHLGVSLGMQTLGLKTDDEIILCLRPIWLILPVVICFFQGLSHANVSGPEITQEDCVRLIKRLMVYPTECDFGRTYGITAGNPQLIPGR